MSGAAGGCDRHAQTRRESERGDESEDAQGVRCRPSVDSPQRDDNAIPPVRADLDLGGATPTAPTRSHLFAFVGLIRGLAPSALGRLVRCLTLRHTESRSRGWRQSRSSPRRRRPARQIGIGARHRQRRRGCASSQRRGLGQRRATPEPRRDRRHGPRSARRPDQPGEPVSRRGRVHALRQRLHAPEAVGGAHRRARGDRRRHRGARARAGEPKPDRALHAERARRRGVLSPGHRDGRAAAVPPAAVGGGDHRVSRPCSRSRRRTTRPFRTTSTRPST